MIPLIAMTATIAVLAVMLPQTRHLSPIVADQIKLPISLINFGLVAFVVGSIGQEFWRAVAVRRSQTGSDPVSSLLGLVLSKRRKYGGYIVHLGIAVLFIGFAGKAYEQMIDRTIEKAAPAPTTGRPQGASTFAFGGYTFSYEALTHTSDDHKDAITATVGIYDGDHRIGTVYPAKWDFHKGNEQVTTEVAIRVRFTEDVYVVLTGYDLESGLANFRVYVNPLILWVWVGFLTLAFGTLVCLIPQALVDRLQWKPKTPLGRAADVGIVVAIATVVVLGLSSQAYANVPAGAATEHVPAGMGMGKAGGGYAAKHRPTNDTEHRAMKELLCPCGCARQNLDECECATAADLRAKVIALLAGADLSSEQGRQAAYQSVLDNFTREYGEKVLATPKSRVPWLFPSLAIVAGLGLIAVIGRRFVARGTAAAQAPATSTTPQRESPEQGAAYTDRLDDELAETD